MALLFKQWTNLIKISLIFVILDGCHSNSVSYKHIAIDENEVEVVVDKFVSLETENTADGNKVVKIVTTQTDQNTDNTRHGGKAGKSDHDLKKSDRDLKKSDRELYKLVQELQKEITELKASKADDRKSLEDLGRKLDKYHDETIVSTAEVIQIRQLVSETFDKAALLEEITQDNSLQLEGLILFQKEAIRDLRRFKEYKEEKAAKRFHQLTNAVERCEQQTATLQRDLNNLTQELRTLHHRHSNLENDHTAIKLDHAHLKSNHLALRDTVFIIQSDLNQTLINITSCCNTQKTLANQKEQYSVTNQKSGILANRIKEPIKSIKDIEIVEFGSGETVFEETEKENYINFFNNVEHGSGQTILEGSGEVGIGETEIPHFVDLRNFVHIDEFLAEKHKWESSYISLSQSYENLTKHMSEIESRVNSIKLGNFMQNLQDSLINFTQNVITLDQWQISSNQIVNSTLNNQDQILKISNMVLDNTDKIADLRWKMSNAEVLSEQQVTILKMYIIRLNNSVEDIKEQMKQLERRNPNGLNGGYQPTFYGYRTVSKTKAEYDGVDEAMEDTLWSQNKDEIEMLKSRLDDLGVQIVFNQNRIGSLEVKLLNDSLSSCRKFNMDAYQDSQLASHEAILKSNMNSITLTHQYLKELDLNIQSLSSEVKSNGHKIRTTTRNLDSLRGIIPAVLGLKREVDNFMFTLPTDCDEYHQRGYRQSGVYVIHPIGAESSSQVTCHMTKDGGWTVIQQRFDGSVDFKRNWTDYTKGFGKVDSEYWFGNYLTYLLTSNKNYTVTISMVDVNEDRWIANYEVFSVSIPHDKYTLHLSGYSGNATDSMSYSSNMAFSTRDRDNDASSTNCAFFYESGWWYKHCQTCNLNGRYDIGMVWFNQNTTDWLRLKSTVMMIKPR